MSRSQQLALIDKHLPHVDHASSGGGRSFPIEVGRARTGASKLERLADSRATCFLDLNIFGIEAVGRTIGRRKPAFITDQLYDRSHRVDKGQAVRGTVLQPREIERQNTQPRVLIRDCAAERDVPVRSTPVSVIAHQAPAREIEASRAADINELIPVSILVVVVKLVDSGAGLRRRSASTAPEDDADSLRVIDE